MRRITPTSLGRFAPLATIGRVAACLALLTGPAVSLAEQGQPADTDRTAVQEPLKAEETNCQAPQEQAQPSKQDQQTQEQRALSQKPNLTEDVRLRAETYTGNDYSK